MKWIKKRRVLTQILLGFLFLFIIGVVFFFRIISSLPGPQEIANIQVSQSTKIYDRTGEILLYEIYGEEKRTIIGPGEIPNFIRQATISVEDDSFYSHPAFDWRGVLRAFTVNIIRGRLAQGGSTITQQLAKNTFLTPQRTISRKIKELVLAMRLEQYYTKDEILDLYLNQVPYGENTYGIESAAENFFGKPAKNLSLNESALLAALPQSPSYYSPWGSHLDELEKRKNFILKRMRELNYIDNEQLVESTASMPKTLPRPEMSIKAPHFVIQVQEYLREKYGEEALRSEGFKVITTLDFNLQKIAEDVVKNGVARNTKLYRGENAALLAMDPQTGQVLAMAGSKDYFAKPTPEGCTPGKDCRFEGNFNVAVQGLRQPGSALKPFVYLTAFQSGLTPNTVVWDVPTEFSSSCPAVVDFKNKNKLCYHPQNFDSIFRGPVKLKDALAQSINVPAVKTLYIGGLKKVLSNMSSFGVSTLNDPGRFGLSLVLGGGEVKLIELTGAYSVLAADGIQHKPVEILKIENSSGNVIEEYKNNGKRVVDKQYPRLINNILSDVELRAPLYHTSLGLTKVVGHQVAIKTGTTNDYVDAWTFGYTPNLVVGVWAGNNNRDPLTSKGSSILAAVPMWHDFISRALKGKPLVTFPRPAQTLTNNPVLQGKLIKGEYHSLLYYLNRVTDPQFNHWEVGISLWLQKHTVNTSAFSFVEGGGGGTATRGGAPTPDGLINIDIISPKNGDFVSGPIIVNASINSKNKLKRIDLYLNNKLIDSRVEDFGFEAEYKKEFKKEIFDLQNIITVRVTDVSGVKVDSSTIFYQ